MRKSIAFMLLAMMLSTGALNSFAAPHQQGQQIASNVNMLTGQITKIRSHNLTVKDQAGKYHVINYSSSSMVQGLKSGDQVTVAFENGKATSIKKIEGNTPAASSNKPM